MSALIDKLFPTHQTNSIQILLDDSTSSRFLVEQEIGKRLIASNEIIEDFPLTQMMIIVSLAPFASSMEECYEIAKIVYWGVKKNDILPKISEHKGEELANRCLISLSFFKKILHAKSQRFGAPNPNYYRQVGIVSFNNLNKYNISENFYQWENFLHEMFCV